MNKINDEFNNLNQKLDSIKKDTKKIRKNTTQSRKEAKSPFSKFMTVIAVLGFVCSFSGISLYSAYKIMSGFEDDFGKGIIGKLFNNDEKNLSSDTETVVSQPIGNTNIVNGGFVCYDEATYYYGGEEALESVDVSNGNQKIIYDVRAYYINSVGDSLFFVSPDFDNAICKIKKDGTDFKIIYSQHCIELTYYDGWLYFCEWAEDGKNHICKIKPNGNNFTVLADCREFYLNIYNDKIFFCDCDDNFSIYSMNLDGTDLNCIHRGRCYDLCVADGKIYFSYGEELRELYCIDIDGSNQELLRDSFTKHINYNNGNLYFMNVKSELCCYNINSRETTYICNMTPCSKIIIIPPHKIYSFNDDEHKITALIN